MSKTYFFVYSPVGLQCLNGDNVKWLTADQFTSYVRDTNTQVETQSGEYIQNLRQVTSLTFNQSVDQYRDELLWLCENSYIGQTEMMSYETMHRLFPNGLPFHIQFRARNNNFANIIDHNYPVDEARKQIIINLLKSVKVEHYYLKFSTLADLMR